MRRFRCNACGGEYDDRQTDGSLYFHTCPPVRRLRVRRNGRDVVIDVGAKQPGDLEVGEELTARSDHRDENAATAGGEADGKRMIRSAGAGRTIIRE